MNIINLFLIGSIVIFILLIIKNIIEQSMIFKNTYGFPKRVNDIWLCYAYRHNYHDNIKYHKNCLFDENDRYKYLESGDITPLLQTDEMIAFYRVINVEQKRGNDRLLWDDGKNYSFIFHHVELIK